MLGRVVSFVPPSLTRTLQPLRKDTTLIASYDVFDMSGQECIYLCTALPSVSYRHKGDRWTHISVPMRDELALLRYLDDNRCTYRKL